MWKNNHIGRRLCCCGVILRQQRGVPKRFGRQQQQASKQNGRVSPTSKPIGLDVSKRKAWGREISLHAAPFWGRYPARIRKTARVAGRSLLYKKDCSYRPAGTGLPHISRPELIPLFGRIAQPSGSAGITAGTLGGGEPHHPAANTAFKIGAIPRDRALRGFAAG